MGTIMDEKEMLEKIEETVCLLYQNQARQAMEQMTEWLEIFQNLLVACGDLQSDEIKSFGLLMIRDLLEAYQSHDIIAIADCMAEKAALFVKAYFWEISAEGTEG